MSWLDQHRFLDTGPYGLTSGDIYFESTRKDKVERIERLRCTHFIDDLEETFLEQSFPQNVMKLLYATDSPEMTGPHVDLTGNWTQMTDHLFDAD